MAVGESDMAEAEMSEEAGLPIGTWRADQTISSASFSVRHMGVATFRGRFEELDAVLTVDADSAVLVGHVDGGSIVVKDSDLQAHLGSPEFFDVERHPQITFRSTSIARDRDDVKLSGDLTIKGFTQTVEAQGAISGATVLYGEKMVLGMTLHTMVDRTRYGLNWNSRRPAGGLALANEVSLTVELALVQG